MGGLPYSFVYLDFSCCQVVNVYGTVAYVWQVSWPSTQESAILFKVCVRSCRVMVAV